MKTRYKHILLAITIFFGLIAVISSVSACMQVNFPLDNGNKMFKIENKKYQVLWRAYNKYSSNENDTIHVDKLYTVKHKGEEITEGYAYYRIEKIKKNRIKVVSIYSTGPPIDNIRIYKTNLSVKSFYWKYIKPKFKNKVDKRAISTESVIDKGKLIAILDYKGSDSSILAYIDHMNLTTMNHFIYWKTGNYTKFSNRIYIGQKYNNAILGSEYYDDKSYSFIILEKTKKNRIKITFNNLKKLNGASIKDKTYNVKTKLSLEKYYKKFFKPKMVKVFSSKV